MKRNFPVFLVPLLGLVFLAISPRVSEAQITVELGPQIGLNISKSNFSDVNSIYNFNTSSVSRLQAGILFNIKQHHFALQPGVFYSQNGFVLKGDYAATAGSQVGVGSIHNVYSLNYLKIPLSVAFTQKENGQGFQVFAGGYIQTLVGGRVVYDNYQGVDKLHYNRTQGELQVKAGNTFQQDDKYYSKRYDAGLQAGVGYRYTNLLFQAAYMVGLTDVGSSYQNNPLPFTQAPSYQNSAFILALSYLFSPFHTKH